MNSTHVHKLSLKLDQTFLTCQKDVSTLSYDSGDIKNVENELIRPRYTLLKLDKLYIILAASNSQIY